MTTRHQTLTVTLTEPIREDDLEHWITAIRLLDKVADVEPGHVDNRAMHTAKRQLRDDAYVAWDELFDFSG